MQAFGTPEKQILIEPVFAQWIQAAQGKTAYGFDFLLASSGKCCKCCRPKYLASWLVTSY